MKHPFILFSVVLSLTLSEKPLLAKRVQRDLASRRLASEVRAFPCSKQMQAQFKQWGVLWQWEKKLGSQSDVPILVSPTEIIGAWVELERTSGKITANRITAQQVTTIIWAAPRCVPNLSNLDKPIDPNKIRGKFTDDYLKELMTENLKSIVYAWSPHMGYSREGIQNIRKAAQKLEVPVFFVLDPKADENLAFEAKRDWGLQEQDLKRMESIELYYRGLLNHFPGSIAFKNGKMVGGALLGLKSENEYVTYFKNALSR